MNAPAEPTQDLGFREIPIRELAVSTTHVQAARRRRYAEAALNELAASIRSCGVLQPILVRPLSGSEIHSFEIVAGERRYIASSRAGMEYVPAFVRALTDAEVLEAQLIENIQREELDPISEAEGLKELMDLKQINVDELGELLGKSRSGIYQRLKLLQLPPEAREALEQGKLDVSRAELVGRIVDPKQQAIALKLATERDWKDRWAHSVRDLQSELTKKGAYISLQGAPFDPADATLVPDMGACTTCPHRTGVSSSIADESPDVCTNSLCHKVKVKAATARRAAEAQAAGKPIVRGAEAKEIAPSKSALVGFVDLDAVCEDDVFTVPEPKYEDSPEYQQAIETWQAREQRWQPRTYRQLLGDADLPVTLMEDPKTKRIRELVPVDQARKALKAKDIQLAKSVGKAPPKQERGSGSGHLSDWHRQHEEQRARQEAETAFRMRVFTEVFPKAIGPLSADELTAIAIAESKEWAVERTLAPLYGDRWKSMGEWSAPEIGRLLRLALVVGEVSHGQPTQLFALAKRYKVDPAKIKAAIAAEKKAAESEGSAQAEKTETPAKTSPASKRPKTSASKKPAAEKKPAKKVATKKAAAKKDRPAKKAKRS